jgi:regulatory protein
MTSRDDYTRTSDKKGRLNKRFDQPREKPKMSSQRYAMYLLSRYEYSAAGLRTKMIQRGYSPEEADAAMAFVTERGYQSDERYAESKARARQSRAGNRKIELVLRSKGIGEKVAREQIANLDPEEDRARRAAEKFRKTVAAEGMTLELKQKIYRYLSTRGFSTGTIKAAIQDLQQPAPE